FFPRPRDSLARRSPGDRDPADPRAGLLLHRAPRDRPPRRSRTQRAAARVRGQRLALGARALRRRAHSRDQALDLAPARWLSRVGAEPPVQAPPAANPAARACLLG